MMPTLFFWLFASIGIISSLFVILNKSPVRSAFCLIAVFFSFSAIYGLLEAHLIAAIQIFIYAGAVMVLFLFVIMLLHSDSPSFDFRRVSLGQRILSFCVTLILFGIFVSVFYKNNQSISPTFMDAGWSSEKIESLGGNVQVLSELLFSEYVLPFELTSILLLSATVGTITLAKRKLKQERI